jgi:hypothetical protein
MRRHGHRGEVKKQMGISGQSLMREPLSPSQYDILHESYLRSWHVDEKASFNEAFLNMASGSTMLSKSRKENTLSRAPLEVKYARGDVTMVLYANNKGGIDITSPVCNTQQAFSHRGEEHKGVTHKLDIRKLV